MHQEFASPAIKGIGCRSVGQANDKSTYGWASQSIDLQLRRLLGDRHYERFQVPLAQNSEQLDDASPANAARLIEHGHELIPRADREIDELCALLVRH